MECRVVIAAAGWLACLLAACVAAPSRSSVAAAPSRPELMTASLPCDAADASPDVQVLLSYAEEIRALPRGELQREYAEREQGLREEASPANRIRLAVLLGLRQAPFRDDARARLLLLQAAHQTGYNAGEYRNLAVLLLHQLDERREMETTLENERKERQALRRKLEQLKAIEEEIDQRMPPVIQPR